MNQSGQLERAFGAYSTGRKIDPKLFSRRNYSAASNDYMQTIDSLPSHRWARILNDIGVDESVQMQNNVTSSLSENRGNLYMPSSPMRAPDNEQYVFYSKADFSLTWLPDESDMM